MSRLGETIVVHKDRFAYLAHPSITVLKNGDWLAAYNHSRRREKVMHPPDDPLHRTLVCRSRDRGASWDAPWFAPDFNWWGRECPALACLTDGTVILTHFKYNWYPLGEARKRHARGERIALNTVGQEWTTEFDDSAWNKTINPWARGVDGLYAHLSHDDAVTFETTVKIDCAPFDVGYSRTGVIELADGRLAYGLTEAHAPSPEGRTFLVCSNDQGRSWSKPIPVCVEGAYRLCEPDIVEAAPGELVCILRQTEEHRLYVCRSSDAGETWSRPEATSIDGLPGHVIKLADGRLLCSYGRRKAPYGIRMSLSEDGGRTWMTDREIVVRDDLQNGDLGYPTTIEYEPGRLFCIYYCREEDGITHVKGTYVDLE